MSDNIKLVIDIPVEMFQEIRDTEFISIETLNASIKAIENGTPLSEVLDEITGEIEREKFEYEQIKDFTRYYGLGIALEIIDKHIGDKE